MTTARTAEIDIAPGLPSLPRWQIWTGRVISALPVLALLASASMKLRMGPEALGMFTAKFGYQQSSLAPIAFVEILCALLYVIPQTAVLGAILATGYLGGAVATHVRVGDPFVAPLLLGVLLWVGLFLREPRLRALTPLRR